MDNYEDDDRIPNARATTTGTINRVKTRQADMGPSAQTPVGEVMGYCSGTMDQLENQISRLRDRLDPVLGRGPGMARDVAKEKAAERSPLVEALQSIGDRHETAADQLRDLLDKLEL